MNRFVQLCLAIAIGIARNQTLRRKTMFYLTLASLGMVFGGVFLLWEFFVAHPLFFAIYWLVCGWMTVTVMLIAIYDLLLVMRAGREAKRRARRDILGRED